MSVLDCKTISSYVAPIPPKWKYTDDVSKSSFFIEPVFAEDGSNECTYQNKVYDVFLKYLREAGGKYFQYILVNLKGKSNLKSLIINI